jgi:hypothetical protein
MPRNCGRAQAHDPLARRSGARQLAALVLASCTLPVTATDFRVGPVDGLLDLNLSYGALYRTSERNPGIIAIGNGGRSLSANVDDGTLNYDTGLASSMLAGTAQLNLRWDHISLFARAIAFHDFEQEDGTREHRAFEEADLDVVGSDVTLRDFYLSARFSPGGMPIVLRVGDQVVNWGETGFVRDGVDTVNALDIAGSLQPARSRRDARLPQGMVWTAVNLTESFALEAFYQYEWRRVTLPPAGYFLSTSDVTGDGRRKFLQLGGGAVSDLGTDLDTAFGLPAGTLGFDPRYLQMPQRQDRRPRDGGQYGLAIMQITPGATALKWGLHYLRYHSRLPIISGLTGDQQAVNLTGDRALQQQFDQLQPLYLQQGLAPPAAAAAADATSRQLALSAYANRAGYFLEYPEDISMFGATFNTATLRTGTLVAAELSHHRDVPLQVSLNAVVNATLSPVQFEPRYGQGALGSYGPGSRIPGFVRLDRTQLALSMAQLLGRRLGAAQTLVGLDAAWVHIHHLPDSGEAPLNAPGGGDADSWGYQLYGQLQYANVFGAVNLTPRLAFIHDVEGFTPAPFAAFWEDRKAVSVGLGGDYINRWTADLSYTAFFDGGDDYPLRDRDFIRLNITYWF